MKILYDDEVSRIRLCLLISFSFYVRRDSSNICTTNCYYTHKDGKKVKIHNEGAPDRARGEFSLSYCVCQDQNKGEGLPQSQLFLSEQDSVCHRHCVLSWKAISVQIETIHKKLKLLIHVKPENTPWVPILTYTLPSILIKRPVFPQWPFTLSHVVRVIFRIAALFHRKQVDADLFCLLRIRV